MSTKHIREFLGYARGLGIEDAQVRQGGKHPRQTGRTPDGRPVRLTLAGSPSDGRRGQRNTEADLRRACR